MLRVISCAMIMVVAIGCVNGPKEATDRTVMLACDPTLQCDDPSGDSGSTSDRNACPCVTAFPDVLIAGSAFMLAPSPESLAAPAVLPIGGIARDPVASLTCDQRLGIEFCIQITNSSGVAQFCSEQLDCIPGTALSLSIVMPLFGPIVDAMTTFRLVILGGRGIHVTGVVIPVGHS